MAGISIDRVSKRYDGVVAVRSANAAFRQVDPSLEETARVTGAGWLRTFGSITLPLARPGLVAGWLLVFVPAIQDRGAQLLDRRHEHEEPSGDEPGTRERQREIGRASCRERV